MLRTVASLQDRPAATPASCVAEAEREARLQCLVAHANVVRVLQPPLGTASFALEWCDFDVATVRPGGSTLGACRLRLPVQTGSARSSVATSRRSSESVIRGLVARPWRVPRARRAAPGASPPRALCALGHCAQRVRRLRTQDVKPANLLVGRDGRLKLADFGSACLVSAALPDASGTTRRARSLARSLGTVAY